MNHKVYSKLDSISNTNAVIITCSSLEKYVSAAQESQGTSIPVIHLDKQLHVEPDRMKTAMAEAIEGLPPQVETVLIATGFCGGVWDHVCFDKRVVIPRVDDCVSMLLTKDDVYCANRKEIGHMYLYDDRPEDFMAFGLMRDLSREGTDYARLDEETLFHMYFDNYHTLDIIDTGLNNCYDEDYVAAAQESADRINAGLDYVEGSNRILEKLVSGQWDEQFIVAEPGRTIRHGDFFE